ncbi:hypothetical protein pD_gene0046 [Vibrio phage 033B]|nr:hypothetical protein pD_gene0046 [Vibrio phage 033B]
MTTKCRDCDGTGLFYQMEDTPCYCVEQKPAAINHTQDNEITRYWKTRTDVLDSIPANTNKPPEVYIEGCASGTRELRLRDNRENVFGDWCTRGIPTHHTLGRLEGWVILEDPLTEPPEETVVIFNGFKWKAKLSSCPGLPMELARRRMGPLEYVYSLFKYVD